MENRHDNGDSPSKLEIFAERIEKLGKYEEKHPEFETVSFLKEEVLEWHRETLALNRRLLASAIKDQLRH